jgi:hypothetical protein
LLAKIVEAAGQQPASPLSYHVVVRGASLGPAIPDRVIGQQFIEPIVQPQLPKLPTIIKDVLQSAPDGLLPNQIIEAVHQRGSQTKPVMIPNAAKTHNSLVERPPDTIAVRV